MIGIRAMVILNLLSRSFIVVVSFTKSKFFFLITFTSSRVFFLVDIKVNLIDSISSEDSPSAALKGSSGFNSFIGLKFSILRMFF